MIEENRMPKNWVEKYLGEVCEILDGFRKPVNARERAQRISNKDQKNLYPYFGATGQVGFIDDFLLEGEFILLGEDGAPFLDPCKDKAYIVNGRFWVNNHAHILKAYISNKFICHYLNQIDYSNYVTGTTRLKLNQSSLKQIRLPVPPFAEQKRIVAKIEELFSEIDKGIENLLKAQELFKAYRQSLLKNAFEGKLTEKWRKDNDIENWRIEKLEKLTTKVGSGATPRGGRDVYKQEGIPLIRSMNVHFSGFSKDGLAFIDELQAKSLDNASVKKGDVLLNITGASIGRVSKAPQEMEGARVNQHVCIIRCSPNILNHTFLQYFLSSPDIQYKIFLENYGVTRQALTKSQILELRIPVPVLEEQELIANQLLQTFSNLTSIEERCITQAELLSQLRQSILKKAFSGELVSQDANDEPATVLLERIKAEKEIPRPQKKKSKQLQKVTV